VRQRYDILFVADPRFEGGSSSSMCVEMRAAIRHGFACGLMMVHGPILRHPLQIHPDIRLLLDDGLLERVDPGVPTYARLVLIHHPNILDHFFQPKPDVTADNVLVILHHPVRDRTGRVQYVLADVTTHGKAAFGRPVVLAPVSAVVRAGLPPLPPGARLLETDWTNLIDLADWPPRPERSPGPVAVIGRHSRPDPRKWPDRFEDALAAYPDQPNLIVRILGGGDFLDELYPQKPDNWQILPFAHNGISDFLAGLDFYVYYHSDQWLEAFGRTILEAICTGLVVILPQEFEVLFGESAVYGPPADVAKTIDYYRSHPEAYAAQSSIARRYAEQNFGSNQLIPRLSALGVNLEKNAAISPAAMRLPLPTRNILFVSSNGIGTGHLTRQMAIADRLPEGLQPAFFTMSYARKAATEAGYFAEYFPHHRATGADLTQWNTDLAEALMELMVHLRPAVLVYDATAVFPGVVHALNTYRDAFSIWVRRPMWQQSHAGFLDGLDLFDAVIEPGELAAEFDIGPTVAQSNQVLRVDPVLHVSPDDRLSKAQARAELDLPMDATVIALQLGSGNNFDMAPTRARFLDELLKRKDVVAFEMRSPIRLEQTSDAPLSDRHIIRELQPSFRYSNAFDASVSAAGYNAFHENILGAIPTVFVPNEGVDMDLQINRCLWADLTGCGWIYRRNIDGPQIRKFVDRLLDNDLRQAVSQRCQSIAWTNGAEQIVAFIEDHARLIRADRTAAVSY
jgi:glycosyltransferase involved in cell wall biosynthesis/UDP:flavonoid glycosyltransferase YjiC (YdhE family)